MKIKNEGVVVNAKVAENKYNNAAVVCCDNCLDACTCTGNC